MITSTVVVFKGFTSVDNCAGYNLCTTKEDRYQETLARIAQLRNAGQEILCRLQPEPENPFDSLAIVFRCEVDSSWHTIGYVVKEALDDVHEAILAKKITAVSFDWVKFIIY